MTNIVLIYEPDSIETRMSRMCVKKIRYKSDFLAAAASGKIKSKKQQEFFLRPYKCPFCDGWHLSSKDRRW